MIESRGAVSSMGSTEKIVVEGWKAGTNRGSLRLFASSEKGQGT